MPQRALAARLVATPLTKVPSRAMTAFAEQWLRRRARSHAQHVLLESTAATWRRYARTVLWDSSRLRQILSSVWDAQQARMLQSQALLPALSARLASTVPAARPCARRARPVSMLTRWAPPRASSALLARVKDPLDRAVAQRVSQDDSPVPLGYQRARLACSDRRRLHLDDLCVISAVQAHTRRRLDL